MYTLDIVRVTVDEEWKPGIIVRTVYTKTMFCGVVISEVCERYEVILL